MEYRKLTATHAAYDRAALQRYSDLGCGGEAFRARLKDYLPQHDLEPAPVYKRRCASAFALLYTPAIVNFFASWLFSSPLVYASEPEERDPYWDQLKEDADGLGTDLDQFLRHAFVHALTTRKAYWRVDFPQPGDAPAPAWMRDWEDRGLGRAALAHVHADCITHWRRDARGAWVWVLEHDYREELLELGDESTTVTERWTLWRADGTAQRWEAVYPKGKPPAPGAAVPEVEPPYNPTGAIPLVELCLPPELHVVGLLADGQLEHFRQSNALSWAIQRTCYAMPWFFLKDARKPPKMGTGYYGILGAEERIEWPAPPAAPFATIQDYNTKLKDELHRVVHQMQMGVENNAAAIGRSGQSKNADNAATEIVLAAMGRVVREPVEKTFDLISRGRGSQATWFVSGMDSYRLPSAGEIADAATKVLPLQIPSPTFRAELMTRVALAQVSDADEAVKTKIRQEIEVAVNAQEAEAQAAHEAGEEPSMERAEQAPGNEEKGTRDDEEQAA
jgi:hypothetical protein